MLVGLIGYGKMGRATDRIAVERGHDVVVLGQRNLDKHMLDRVDCGIDFSNSSFAPSAISELLSRGINVVSGTTGWGSGQLAELMKLSEGSDAAFCWSPNFSIGMQLVFNLNKRLAGLMASHAQYSPALLEIHHKGKVDSPSGTAIALSQQIIEIIDGLDSWISGKNADAGELSIESQRTDDVKGIHRITYSSKYDTISLRHRALSRDGFALGAVIASEMLQGKRGFITFAELLNFTGDT